QPDALYPLYSVAIAVRALQNLAACPIGCETLPRGQDGEGRRPTLRSGSRASRSRACVLRYGEEFQNLVVTKAKEHRQRAVVRPRRGGRLTRCGLQHLPLNC